ncbi:hypothetical protein ACEWY4_024661 [Coilia grayii]|uniref:Uncharacterized protein n=1 Tax=Coilia grayii TaxID=363190 RepID=A0ABD1IVC9_9TELE
MLSFCVCLHPSALPTVEVVSPQSPFYSGDAVTLRCDIPKYTDWHQYVWLKDNSTVPGKTNQTITITLPHEAGQYQCYRRREDSSVAPYMSRPVKITFTALPSATVVVVSPQSPFYSGDAVTLKCNITQYTDWHQYVWLKDNSTVPGKTTQTITITLPQEAGHYQCYRRREDRSNTSSLSGPVTIKNNDKLVLVYANKTWMEALQYCREHHVDLVSVSSEQIQHWVEGWAKGASSPHVWLGLRYSCNLGIWFWVKGVTVCYDNWASDAEREQGCARRVGAVGRDGGQWVSLEETDKLNFICTNERKSVSVCQGCVCTYVCVCVYLVGCVFICVISSLTLF